MCISDGTGEQFIAEAQVGQAVQQGHGGVAHACGDVGRQVLHGLGKGRCQRRRLSAKCQAPHAGVVVLEQGRDDVVGGFARA